MLTWSSWLAEVGKLSTLAGWASDLFSLARDAAVTWAITVAWLPFAWERFYLPLLPAFLLAAAHGAVLVTRGSIAAARAFVPRPRLPAAR